MTQFLGREDLLPPYMAFPRFLLDRTEFSETAKILYVLLLDRARLSQTKEGFADEWNHVFIYFPIKDLAAALHKSEMSIKTGLAALEKAGLILRKRQKPGIANKIYVKIPPMSEERNLSLSQTANCLSDGQDTVCLTDRKLSGSNNKDSNKQSVKPKSNIAALGSYKNVFLSVEEQEQLHNEIPNCEHYIEKLSRYMQSTGKQYADHAATIRSWYLRDTPQYSRQIYAYDAEDSL